MPSRYRSRQTALQILYQCDMRKLSAGESILAYYGSLAVGDEPEAAPEPDDFARSLVTGTVARSADIDRLILQHSQNWRLDRMPAVDRNILRMAIYEMMEEGTPPAVVIDQALELARRFSTDESTAFINGVLDAVHRSLSARPALPAQP